MRLLQWPGIFPHCTRQQEARQAKNDTKWLKFADFSIRTYVLVAGGASPLTIGVAGMTVGVGNLFAISVFPATLRASSTAHESWKVTVLRVSPKEAKSLATDIARQLGETEPKPHYQIARIIMFCGLEFAQEVTEAALQVEAGGGMMTLDGERRRTPGGIFFHLARERMPDDVCQEIFYPWRAAARRKAAFESQFSPFEWENRAQVLAGVLAERGKVSDVKVTLTGRADRLERRQNLVIIALEDDVPARLNVPAGVPEPAPDAVIYTVYISSSQWIRVEESLEDPEDELVIEGVCAPDAETGSMVVYALQVTTAKQQKQSSRAQTRHNDGGVSPKTANKSSKAQRLSKPKPSAPASPAKPVKGAPEPPEPIDIVLPPGISDEAARKLRELHTAAATYRQKIAMLRQQPDGQRFGLEMTQKLLANTEKQIRELERQLSK